MVLYKQSLVAVLAYVKKCVNIMCDFI